MKRIVFAAALGLGVSYAASATPISMSTISGTYTQTFDSLISSGSATWTDDSTLSGWYAQRSGSGTTILGTNGNINTGALYSMGATGTSDRALGSVGSGTVGSFAWGVLLQNKTGFTVTNLTLRYWGEEWRMGAAAAQAVSGSYATASSPITALTPTTDASWTRVAAWDFTSPTILGTTGQLDGNVASNRTFVTGSVSLSLANNDYVMVRWRDIDHPSSDQMMGIDEVGISWTAIPEPTTVAMLGLVPVLAVLRRALRRRDTSAT